MTDQRAAGALALGIGIGWRPELAELIASDERLFIEVIAENLNPRRLPGALAQLVAQGRPVIPHGIRLSLGGAERPDGRRLDHLAAVAEAVHAPFVSEHIAFARAHGVEAGHVLPVPRTAEALEIIGENVVEAQTRLPVSLALEHVAALVQWPDPEMSETEFISELLARTDALLLLDVSNLYANALNHGFDPVAALGELPLERIAYVHIGGGRFIDGRYHDTHADPVLAGVLELVEELCARTNPAGLLLERDANYPSDADMREDLDGIESAARAGAERRANRGT
jgi:uncharacterized protein (UPF0276 family)